MKSVVMAYLTLTYIKIAKFFVNRAKSSCMFGFTWDHLVEAEDQLEKARKMVRYYELEEGCDRMRDRVNFKPEE